MPPLPVATHPGPVLTCLPCSPQGLAMGFAPQLSWDGTGGTYMLRDAARQPLAAFKPRDEEPFTPNNPRGLEGKMGQQGIHGSIASGEAHVREMVVFKLDHGHHASVPLTLQAEAVHPAFHVHSHVALSRYGAKVGSLQAWVHADDVAANLGAATFPTREVHKIALLDMRFLNTDRNDSNILVRKRTAPALELIDSTPASPVHPSTRNDSRHSPMGSTGAAPIIDRGRDGPADANSARASPMDLSATPCSWMCVALAPPPLSLPASMESVNSLVASEASSSSSAAAGTGTRSAVGLGSLSHLDSPESSSTSPTLVAQPGGSSKVRPCELIPIDHGGCLPSTPAIMWYNWCWLSWPQLDTPPDDETQQYIASLNPAAEAKLLAEYGIAPSAIRASRCATLLVQRSVAAGLTLHDAALMLCRPDDEVPSELERIISQAERLVVLALNNPRLRSNPDALGCAGFGSPTRRQAVGSGMRPEHAFSAQNLSALEAESLPVSGSRQISWGDGPMSRESGRTSAFGCPAAVSLQRPAGAAALPHVWTESDFVEVSGESPFVPRPKLHRVSSEMAIASTPSSPFSALEQHAGGHEHAGGELMDAVIEPIFYEYFGRMLDEAVRRTARRGGVPTLPSHVPTPHVEASRAVPTASAPEAGLVEDAGCVEAKSPSDVISDFHHHTSQEPLLSHTDLPTVGLPSRRRLDNNLSTSVSITE